MNPMVKSKICFCIYNKISKAAFLLPAAFTPVKMHSVWPEIKCEFLVLCHFHSPNSTLFLAFVLSSAFRDSMFGGLE